jgi:hypothetical protein
MIPLAALAPIALVAQPTNNPVLDTFPTSGSTTINDHTFGDYSWTADLKWGTVTTTAANGSDTPPNHPDATATDISGSAADDLATVQAEIDTISASGGGVLYFPAGDYFFSDDLVLKDGVIIRGETPTSQTDAREMNYDPATNFWFPKVEHIVADSNVPRTGMILDTASAAFSDKEELLSVNKVIKTDAPLFDSNLGVVDIDIQRARINFIERSDSTDGSPGNEFDDFAQYFGTNAKNRLQNENIVVFGNRINNATAFDPRVPFHPGEGAGMNTWQRWHNRAHAKIDVMAGANVMIANNRIGDHHWNYLHNDTANKAIWPIDDFAMPARGTGLTNADRYLQKGGGVINDTVYPGVSDSNFGYIFYRYNAGLGILMNRSSRTGYQRMNHPATEPSIYLRNIVARQNWVHVIDRVGIQGSGNGLEMRDNVRVDYSGRINWMNPQGTEIQTNNSATYENRGMDFAGVNILIDNNDITVKRGSIRGGYPTIDGEGILIQDNDAGYIENVSITNNTMRDGPIMIWKIRYIRNMDISGNHQMGGDPIFILTDSNSQAGSMYGLTVDNNIAENGILFRSEILPYEISFTNNQVTGGSLAISDYSAVIPNESVYTLSGNNVSPSYVLHGGNGGTLPFSAENILDFPPQVKILEPDLGDDLTPGEQVTVRVEVTMDPFGITPLDKVNFYDNTTISPNAKLNNGNEWSSSALSTNLDDNLATLQLILEGSATDGLGSGVYTGTWTVPAGISYGYPLVEARAQAVTIRSIGMNDSTVQNRSFANRTWAFLEEPTGTPGPIAAPVIISSQFVGGAFEVEATDLTPGTSYKLTRDDDLSEVSFSDIGVDLTASSETETFVDPNPPASKAFYQVESQP